MAIETATERDEYVQRMNQASAEELLLEQARLDAKINEYQEIVDENTRNGYAYAVHTSDTRETLVYLRERLALVTDLLNAQQEVA